MVNLFFIVSRVFLGFICFFVVDFVFVYFLSNTAHTLYFTIVQYHFLKNYDIDIIF